MEFSDIPKVYSIFNDETPMLPDSVTSTVGICGPASIMYFKFHTPYGLVMLAKTFLPHRAMEVTMHDYSWCDKTVPKLLARYIVREASLAFNDDILIWNLKAYPAKPILLKEDIAIKRVRQWYSQFYSAAEKKRGGWEEVGGGVFVAPAAEPDLLQQKQQVEINSKPSSSASTTSSTFSTTPLSPMTTTSIPLGCSSSSSSSKNSTNIESLPGCPGSIDVDW